MVPADRTEARPQKRIGKYIVTGRIGRGGMGMVYRGYDELLERDVAVKTLTAEGMLDEESRQRFAIEARAAARLQHPNIVTVYELGEDRGLPFIAMELLSGVDFETLMKSGEPLLVEEKLDVLAQVCRGVQYAHDHGVVHRDIKPSNIRLLEDGTAKIMDFGIAKLGGTGVTKTGMMVGTVHYMSPEQIRGRPLDGRSDVFSIGVILYELMAGARPFTGDGATDVLYKIVHTPSPSLETAVAAAVPGLQEALAGALAKDPTSRPTAGKLADELAAVLAAHRGARPTAPAPATLETVNMSRRLLKEGRVDEGLRRLQEIAAAHPFSLEARRALRLATRETQRRGAAAPDTEADAFPELEPTPSAGVTRVSSETVLQIQPGALQPVPASGPAVPGAAPAGGAGLLWSAAAVVAVALGVGAFLLLRSQAAAPAAAPTRAEVRKVPAGAARPAEATVPAAQTAEVTVPAPSVEPAPADAPPAPQGRVSVRSSYPVDVMWRGQVLSRGRTSAEVRLPVGRQTITIASADKFLRTPVSIEVREDGERSVEAPPLGTIHIKANPDNCQVFIDGAFVDYPPILDRSIAAGAHRIGFKWADGERREETVEVKVGSPVYVMGRRD